MVKIVNILKDIQMRKMGTMDNDDNEDNYDNDTDRVILEICDLWDTDHISYKWEQQW